MEWSVSRAMAEAVVVYKLVISPSVFDVRAVTRSHALTNTCVRALYRTPQQMQQFGCSTIVF
jgi:hypothetical protein|eukprot:m.225266 g.225266  ORF g.225266 m.225266 type:complete len:62 (+) comp25899_c0_seq18:688-873(+)